MFRLRRLILARDKSLEFIPMEFRKNKDLRNERAMIIINKNEI
jgi:hypothetical protein